KIIYANKAFGKLTGISQQELLGRSPDILCDQRKSGGVMMEFYNNCRDGGEFSLQFDSYRRNGDDFEMKISVTPMLDELGGNAHYILTCAEVKRAESVRQPEGESDLPPLMATKTLPEVFNSTIINATQDESAFEYYPQQVTREFAAVQEEIES